MLWILWHKTKYLTPYYKYGRSVFINSVSEISFNMWVLGTQTGKKEPDIKLNGWVLANPGSWHWPILGICIHNSMGIRMRLVSKIDWCFPNWLVLMAIFEWLSGYQTNMWAGDYWLRYHYFCLYLGPSGTEGQIWHVPAGVVQHRSQVQTNHLRRFWILPQP